MSEEKLQVLKMLEQGRITHEEALSLLKALNEGSEARAQQQAIPETTHEVSKAVSEIRSEVRDGLNEGLAELRSSLKDAFKDVRVAMQDVSGELGEAMDEVRSELTEAMNDIPRSFSGLDWLSGLFSFGVWPEYRFTAEEVVDVPAETEQLTLAVDTKNGYIRLLPSDDESICLSILKKIRAESKEKAEEMSERCVVVQPSNEGSTMQLQLSVDPELQGAVSFAIHIPRHLVTSLNLHTKNGSVDLTDISGSGTIESKNGRLQITGGHFQDIRAITKNGSINLATDATEMSAETKNGAVHCRLQPTGSSKLMLESKNGSIHVEAVPSEAGYRVDASTTHGVAKVTLAEFVAQHQTKQSLVGESKSYEQAEIKVDLRLITKNGSVSVHEAE